jgi:hypothetical protein
LKRASDCPRDNRDVILLLANIALLVAGLLSRAGCVDQHPGPDLTPWLPRLPGLVT